LRKIIGFIFRQYDVGQWWGALSQTLAQIMAFVTVFNTALLIPTAYVTWFSPWVLSTGLKITFTTFILIIFIVSVFVLLAGYKLLTPSSFAFWTAQFWKHRNPIKIKLDKIEKNQGNQDKRLKAIEEALRELVRQRS